MLIKVFNFENFNDQILIHKNKNDVIVLWHDIWLHSNKNDVALDIYIHQISTPLYCMGGGVEKGRFVGM